MKFVNYFSNMDLYNSAKLLYPNISFIEETEKVILAEKPSPKNNQIFYTSTDGNIVEMYNKSGMPLLISNTYEDGQGIMTFERDVTSIGNTCFYNKSKLNSIILPNSLKTIAVNALSYTNLSSINIPSGVTMVYSPSLTIKTLTSITVDQNNTFLSSEGNCLTMGNKLIRACNDSIIPESVTEIGASAFASCTSLTSVNIFSGVTSFGESAFASCTSLTNIRYDGTSEQFKTITKGRFWKDRVPTSCIVHCTDGDFPITQF